MLRMVISVLFLWPEEVKATHLYMPWSLSVTFVNLRFPGPIRLTLNPSSTGTSLVWSPVTTSIQKIIL